MKTALYQSRQFYNKFRAFRLISHDLDLSVVLRDDPMGRVACETLVNTGLVVVSGETTTETYVDIQDVARSTIKRIGYTNAEFGYKLTA